ncbi:MAG TPA: hypothetical protein VKF40_06295 [Burkholderiales bacterium]|nr:hypothetical protein [Burkholderiales bacterium]
MMRLPALPGLRAAANIAAWRFLPLAAYCLPGFYVLKGTTMAKIFLVAPDAPMEDVTQMRPGRKLGSGGIRLGVLDNSKANADHLLNLIVEGVKKEVEVDTVVMKRKPTSSRPATDEMLDEFAREADLVLSAMAD